MSKAIIFSALMALAEARFGQEQIPVSAVSALGNEGFGDAGAAATIAGSIPASLLAAANPCNKLTIADQIIEKLGTDQKVIDAAKGLVAAETNFNPFVVNKPFVCVDPTLPVSEQLRGIVPLVDPAVGGQDVENVNSANSVKTPFDAAGLSQAEVMIAQGFSNFTAVKSDGTDVVLGGQDGAGAAESAGGANIGSGNVGNGTASNGTAGNGNTDNNNNDTGGAITCGGSNGSGNANNGTTSVDSGDNGSDTGADNVSNSTSTKGLDFGVCQPTMARVGGLNGRPATEFTFIPQDALVAKGQQEALNPSIITNRICDQLTNVCNATADAKAACLDAKAQIAALGTRDQSTADTWNGLLGFAGVDSSVATI